MPLRDFQLQAVRGIDDVLSENRSALVVAPTGCGKTQIFCSHLATAPARHMVIAHREELIFQAQARLEQFVDTRVGVEMADFKAATMGVLPSSVISTVQTQVAKNGAGVRRMENFDPQLFHRLVIDEAHHAAADTYREVIDHYMSHDNCKLIGVTATPNRHDEKALGEIFDEVAFCWDFSDAAREGWLVPVRVKVAKVEGLDLRRVRTHGKHGDFVQSELAAIMKRDKVLYEIGLVFRALEPKRTLVFCVGVQQAEGLCQVLLADGRRAAWVCGKTPKPERRDLLRQFASGEVEVMVNVGVLTEGFDDPGIERIVMARPTKSDSLYRQMMGRGTRPVPGLVDPFELAATRRDAISESLKPWLEVVDIVGVADRDHKPITAVDALSGDWDDDVVDKAEDMADSEEFIDVVELLSDADQALDEEQKALAAAEAELERQRQMSQRTAIEFHGKATIVDWHSNTQNERLLGKGGRHRPRGYYAGRRPTDKQLACLERAGVFYDETTTFTEASKWIGRIIDRHENKLATFKQLRQLEKNGYLPQDGKLMTNVTFEEAHAALDKLFGSKPAGRQHAPRVSNR